jgi:ABC-2 type transport system permease protein
VNDLPADMPVTRPAPVGELQEVSGPSALGGGSRRFFDLLWLISVTEFRRIYFGTVLGYLWSLIRPLMFFGVLLFVFTQVFKVGASNVDHYAVLLLLGIVLFTFFQESTTNAVTSVVAQEGVVRKTQFPRLVIPVSTVLTGLFNLGLNLIIVVVFLFAFGVDPVWTWLLFPFAVVALFVLTVAVAMGLSVLYVRFRDVAIIWTVVAQVLFYATPILYTVGFKNTPQDPYHETFEHLMMINPLAVIMTQVRVWVLHEPQAPSAVQAAGGWLGLLPAAAISVGVVLLGVWLFNREAPRIAEDL